MKEVDLSLPPDAIREFCEQNDWWALELPVEWQSSDVEALYARQLTGQRPYLGLISEIADDPRAAALLNDIWERFGDAIEVASALALNPATPVTLLSKLLAHEDETVRQHANQRVATIYVRLPDEAVDVWRPVLAARLQGESYQILEQPYDLQTERWEFAPGEIVECQKTRLADGEVVAATRRLR